MSVIFTNNAASTLQGTITAGAVTIAVAASDAGEFPAPTGGNWAPITVVDSSGNLEIMRCTARSGANLTVTRAQEGTTAFAFSAGARVEHRLTAGALADMVAAANLLPPLLTVDGAGSNLDADLLDGQQGSYYQNADNLNAGTVPDNQLPGRLAKTSSVATTITDWNDALENGWYSGNNAANTPTATWYLGVVVARSATYIEQEVWAFTAAHPQPRYRRVMLAGAWQPWLKVNETANVGNTGVWRASNGDISARTFRSEFATPNASIASIMTQVEFGGTGDNYIRPSTPAQAGSALRPHVATHFTAENAAGAALTTSYQTLHSTQFVAAGTNVFGVVAFNAALTTPNANNNVRLRVEIYDVTAASALKFTNELIWGDPGSTRGTGGIPITKAFLATGLTVGNTYEIRLEARKDNSGGVYSTARMAIDGVSI